MLKILVCICVVLGSIESVWAQVLANTANAPEIPASYIVQLTEYRLDQPVNPSQSVAEILTSLSKNDGDAKGKAVETIRLSALSGTESTVQFGRTVFVTSGKSMTNRGETLRSVQGIEIGTTVKVSVSPQNDKVAMTLDLESSKLGEDAGDDIPPSISRTKINTNQLLELGKPNWVGGSTTSSSSILVVTITRN